MNFKIINVLCITLLFAFGAEAQKFKKKYKDLLEPGSKLIDSGYNFTIEKTTSGDFILKRYYPENRQITHFLSSNSKSFAAKNGLYYHCYDDGSIVEKGNYANDIKIGQWIENLGSIGTYESGIKTGQWLIHNADSVVVERMNYLDGQLDGEQISYDSLGQISQIRIFEKGELVASETSQDSTWKVVEKMPQFPGCVEKKLSKEELRSCGNRKMLEHIYKNIRYPSLAREYGVEGTAIIRFVVDKDGSVKKVEALNGVSHDIKMECIRLVNSMPNWKPGYQDGKPVKVYFNLPIKFRLQ